MMVEQALLLEYAKECKWLLISMVNVCNRKGNMCLGKNPKGFSTYNMDPHLWEKPMSCDFPNMKEPGDTSSEVETPIWKEQGCRG
jgi:hypothetical protein